MGKWTHASVARAGPRLLPGPSSVRVVLQPLPRPAPRSRAVAAGAARRRAERVSLRGLRRIGGHAEGDGGAHRRRPMRPGSGGDRMLALTLAAMCLSTPATAADSAVARFGKPLKGLKPTPLSEVLASAKDGQTVRLEGKAET